MSDLNDTSTPPPAADVTAAATPESAPTDPANEPATAVASGPERASVAPQTESTNEPVASRFSAPDFQPTSPRTQQATLDFLDDVDLNVKVELGRTEMLIEDVLRLGEGAVIELDKLAGDPVDIYCNDRLIARGEVLVLNDTFCVRVNDIVSPVAEDEATR